MNALFTVAILMGLAGSLHCVGMCGPIMLFLPFHHFTGLRKAAAIALYHFARISVYAMMALVIYSFRSVFNPVVQQYISIVLGSLFLFAGVISFLPFTKKLQVKLPWTKFVTKQLGEFMGNPGLPSIFISGMLNGLLPCGLVYMMLSATLALHTATHAVLFAYIFGVGTVPALVSIILFRSRINVGKIEFVKKYTPVVVFLFGIIFLLRGLNLDIPYLSPKVQVINGEVRSCCHKK
jgi:uncharacterized protein